MINIGDIDCMQSDFVTARGEKHEVADWTHGLVNIEDSTSIDNQGTKVEYEVYKEKKLVTIEDLTSRYDSDFEFYNNNDITPLPQDMAAFAQEENNDLHSTFEVTHGASMGHDDVNDTTHYKSDFVYFGAVDIEHC